MGHEGSDCQDNMMYEIGSKVTNTLNQTTRQEKNKIVQGKIYLGFSLHLSLH